MKRLIFALFLSVGILSAQNTFPPSNGSTSGVSSFNTRTGAVVPAAGDYSSQQLGDFLVTRVSDTQLSVAGGAVVNGGSNVFPGATINIVGAVGNALITLYVSFNDGMVHGYPSGGTPDMRQLSGTNFVSDADAVAFNSNNSNTVINTWGVISSVFAASTISDLRALGLQSIVQFGFGPGISVPGSGAPGTYRPQIDPNGPTGLWQKWNISVDLTRGPIATAAPNSTPNGNNYTPGDVLALTIAPTDGSSGGTFVVDTVDGNGGILTGHVGAAGTFYGLGTYVTTGGTGTGAIILIETNTPVPAFVVTNPDGSQATVALASALTQTILLPEISGQIFLDDLVEKSSTAFAGTTTLVCNPVFDNDGSDIITAPYDLMAAVSNTNFAPSNGFLDRRGFSNYTNDSVDIIITSTGANLDQLTAGSLDIPIKYAVRP